MKTIIIFLSAINLSGIGQIASAQTWLRTSAPTANWFSIASSADGAKLAVVSTGRPDLHFDKFRIHLDTKHRPQSVLVFHRLLRGWSKISGRHF